MMFSCRLRIEKILLTDKFENLVEYSAFLLCFISSEIWKKFLYKRYLRFFFFLDVISKSSK